MTEGITYERDAEGVVTLTIDLPGRPVNTMGAAYRAAMGEAVDRLEAERADVRGVLVTSGKDTFFAGADIDEIYTATRADAAELAAAVDLVKAQLRRLETLGVPVVAAINGSAMGGGLEIALACHHRICLDDDAAPKARLGLPEVTLGLLPGGGGVTRLVRMLGVAGALPLLTEGKRLRPSQALAAGIVDELAGSREDMLAAARAWIQAHPESAQAWDAKGYRIPGGTAADPRSYSLLAAAPAALHERTRGTLPAPGRILAAAAEGSYVDVETAFAIETDYLVELATGQVAKNLITTFWYGLQQVEGGVSRPPGHERSTVSRLAVLGAGMMGAGIAQVAAQRGLEVVLKDVGEAAAVQGRDKVATELDRLVERGRMTAPDRDAVLARITATGSDDDLAGCDAVVEAVFEDRELKAQVLAAAEQAVAPGALVASNTSTLPITGLAANVKDPAGFVGLHFFSPVPRMPLVEIVRGQQTSDATIARAFDLVRQLGKTPIVVGDGRGFFTSRVFATFTTEGIAMLGEGVPAALIENVARHAGFPVGPLAVADEVSLTLVQRIRRQTVADLEASGQPVPSHPAYAVVDVMTEELGRPGRAAGQGFYDYPAEGRKRLWPGLAERFGAGSADVPEADVRDRLLLAPCLETVRCLEDGVLSSAADANVGSIMGIGFPPWTGGVLQHLEALGLEAAVARADELAARYGDRFAPPDLLRRKAADGSHF